ncbi:MAG TPA: NUDIX domain-containing protein [Patescibacteria group bacterium]|jgi:8-oxo-dGTP pyrophosphatase MutT (NUDIX family)|nr:NUDIX domain-containing protein [Patescibacteria group bacterium]
MSITDIVNHYLELNPKSRQVLSLLQEQIANETYEELISRKNFVGHITGAAFVVSKKSKRVLLLEHKALQKMLQPGGHVDYGDDGPLGGAYREVEEETGIRRESITYRAAVPGSPEIPFYIETHHIPANELKKEPAHYHHDFRYLFLVEDESVIEIDSHESTGFKWVEWREFAKDEAFKQSAQKIEHGQLMPASSLLV